MIRRFIFLFPTLLVSCILCIGQNSHNYIDYFNSTNSIELLVRKQQYKQAILAYENLRIDFPSFFAKDLHNLSICYLKTNQQDSVVSLARQLVLQGRELHDFDRYYEYKDITNTNCWNVFVDEYPDLRKRYEQGIDKEFDEMVTKFYVSDQKFQKISDEKRDSVYHWQGVELFLYMLRDGFPSIFRNENTNCTQLEVVLRHFFYQYKNYEIDDKTAANSHPKLKNINIPLDQFMLNALKDGKLTPSSYEQILYAGSKSPYGNVGIRLNFYTESTSLRFGPYENNYDLLNKSRESIGLACIDSTMSNLEGTWYNQISYSEIKEAYQKCDTCETYVDYFKLSAVIRNRVRNEYKNKELESFIFSYNPNDIMSFEMFGAQDFMPNINKK